MSNNINNTEIIFKCNLHNLRTSAQLTKSEAADGLGLSRGYYHTLENIDRHKSPSFDTLERIAAYYKIGVSELFKNNRTSSQKEETDHDRGRN